MSSTKHNPKSPSLAGLRFSGLKVLIVDDNQTDQVALKRFCERDGHRAVVAWNGSEALRLAKNESFDLVLLDINMPVMNGIETARQLRLNTKRKSLPIIAISSSAEPGLREDCKNAGIDELVEKPISQETLAKLLLRIPRTVFEILIIEDNSSDWELAQIELNGTDGEEDRLADLTWCQRFEDGLNKLNEKYYDLVLLDYSLPDSQGLSSLNRLLEIHPNLPVILLTGLDDEKLAVSAIHSGAQDYVVKGSSPNTLRRAVRYALERNEIHLELKRAERRAQAASEAKSAFLANMSHEIRTPLTAILGFADVAWADAKTNTQKSALQKIKRNGEHLLQVINDILDLSKIEAGKMSSKSSRISLFDLLDDIRAGFSLRAQEKGISFEITCDYPLPEILTTDPLHLKQILFNLVGNAIKFTTEGGVVLNVKYRAEPSELILSVIDTGIGISDEAASKLFQAFSQGDVSTTRKFGGTGLGLMISKHLARTLGADITLSTAEGKGSTFRVVLPVDASLAGQLVYSQPEAVSINTNDVSEVPKLGGSILVADDMQDNRELLDYFLRSAGFEVTLACNGQEALDLAQDNRFDVILLDMQMPILDGYQCVRNLRELGCDTQVVAVTASALSPSVERCLEAGCNAYLSKPFKPSELYKVLKESLAAARRSSALNSSSQSLGNSVLLESDKEPEISKSDLAPIVAGFLTRLPGRLSRLRSYYQSHQVTELKSEAHQLAGAGLFGFDALGDAARNLEDHVEHASWDLVGEKLKIIELAASRAAGPAQSDKSDPNKR